jgi:hypothetical protein
MGKRRSERIDCKLNAWTTFDYICYNGVIENISKEGLLNIIPDNKVVDVFPDKRIEINFKALSGPDLNITCKIIWSRIKTNVPFGLIHFIGMEVIKPPQEYKNFVKNLYKKTQSFHPAN